MKGVREGNGEVNGEGGKGKSTGKEKHHGLGRIMDEREKRKRGMAREEGEEYREERSERNSAWRGWERERGMAMRGRGRVQG